MTDNSNDNIYDRNRLDLFDGDGDFCHFYMRHLDRMTVESLHSKSDIAAELAWRDLEIQRLNEAAKSHTLYITRVDELGYELGAVATDYMPTFLRNFVQQQKATEIRLGEEVKVGNEAIVELGRQNLMLTEKTSNDTALWEARHDAQVEELEGHEATIKRLTKERDEARNAIILYGKGNDFDWRVLGELERLKNLEADLETEVMGVIDLLPEGSLVMASEEEDSLDTLRLSVTKGCELFKDALAKQQQHLLIECQALQNCINNQSKTIRTLRNQLPSKL